MISDKVLNLSGKVLTQNHEETFLNKFEVENFEENENHVIFINKERFEKLSTTHSKYARVEGKRNCVFIIIPDESVDSNKIRMSKVARKNIRSEIGDQVNVVFENELPTSKEITILPFEDCIKQNQSNQVIFNQYLSPHFEGTELPVAEFDIISTAIDENQSIEFRIVSTDNTNKTVLVGSSTKINWEGTPLKRNQDEQLN